MINRIKLARSVATAMLALALAGIAGCSQMGMGLTLEGDRNPKRDERGGLQQYVMAVRAQQNGDNDAAMDHLLKATAADPNLTMAHSMLGDTYRARGDYDLALHEYERAALLDPYTAENHYKLGIAYQLLQRPADAAKSYQRTLELEPNHFGATMNLGLVEIDLGRLEDAVAHTQRAVELDPTSAIATSNFGVALDAHGQYADAEVQYRRSLEIDPKQEVTRLNLATNLLAQEKIPAAIAVLREVIVTSDTPVNHKRLGDAFVKSDDKEQAMLEYEKALQLDAKYYPAMNSIAAMRIAEYKRGLELDQDKRKAAVEMWTHSLEINPKQPKIKDSLKEFQKK